MTSIYIDFENDNVGRIIEIGAVILEDEHFIQEYHSFINERLHSTYSYYKTAENSHCISPQTLYNMGISRLELNVRFRDLLLDLKTPITFKGHGLDITQEAMECEFPFLRFIKNITYQQLHLPTWDIRVTEQYFLSALKMKETTNIASCCATNHEILYDPYWNSIYKKPTACKRAKSQFGFHCALFDSYLLAFYDKTLDYYCCDISFNTMYPIFKKPITYSTVPTESLLHSDDDDVKDDQYMQ